MLLRSPSERSRPSLQRSKGRGVWRRSLPRGWGEVLELGCGRTGRILIRAAEAGATITGLDQAGFMLERCRSKLRGIDSEVLKRVTLVEADMTNFTLDRLYALATVPFRPLQHLVSVEEQLRFLTCVHRHLEPGGRLALDVFHPDLSRRLATPASPEEIEDTPEYILADWEAAAAHVSIDGQARRSSKPTTRS